MFENVHTGLGLPHSVRIDREGGVRAVTNLGWLHSRLRVRGVYAEAVEVRERTDAERIRFPTYDCVYEVKISDGFGFSCMFASRAVLLHYLHRSRNLRGVTIKFFGRDTVIDKDLQL